MAALSVGLTGGIGAGKSEVAQLLASYGAVVIDADQLAREVVAPGTDGLADVVEEFGREVLRSDGALDRDRLGEIVFADPAKRERLNAIVHPKVGERAGELRRAAPDDAVVVYDVPLLVENGLAGDYDVVVVVEAACDTQVERLARSRDMPADRARARIGAQTDPASRRAVADVVIDNDGPRTALEPQVYALWERLKTKAEG